MYYVEQLMRRNDDEKAADGRLSIAFLSRTHGLCFKN